MTSPFLQATLHPQPDPAGLQALRMSMHELDEMPEQEAGAEMAPGFNATYIGDGPGVYEPETPDLVDTMRATHTGFSVAERLQEYQAEQAQKAESEQQQQQQPDGQVEY